MLPGAPTRFARWLRPEVSSSRRVSLRSTRAWTSPSGRATFFDHSIIYRLEHASPDRISKARAASALVYPGPSTASPLRDGEILQGRRVSWTQWNRSSSSASARVPVTSTSGSADRWSRSEFSRMADEPSLRRMNAGAPKASAAFRLAGSPPRSSKLTTAWRGKTTRNVVPSAAVDRISIALRARGPIRWRCRDPVRALPGSGSRALPSGMGGRARTEALAEWVGLRCAPRPTRAGPRHPRSP